MKIILSIKPEFVEKIFSGEKIYEFRKAIFKRKVQNVVVYASYPVGKIIGEFEIDDIIQTHPEELWNETKEGAGVDKSFFDKYFSGREKGYAIKIKKYTKYNTPIDPYSTYEGFKAPQSFMYWNN